MCDIGSKDSSSVLTQERAAISHGLRKEMIRTRVSLLSAKGRECAIAEGEGEDVDRRRVGVLDTPMFVDD
jgi:hypothetical protein